MRNESLLHDPAGLGIFLVMARALAPAPFQPDFGARRNSQDYARRSPREDRTPAVESQRPTVPTSAPRKIGLLERLDRWFWAQQQRDMEAYLAQSVDVHDLEQRMRNLERSAWHRYN